MAIILSVGLNVYYCIILNCSDWPRCQILAGPNLIDFLTALSRSLISLGTTLSRSIVENTGLLLFTLNVKDVLNISTFFV